MAAKAEYREKFQQTERDYQPHAENDRQLTTDRRMEAFAAEWKDGDLSKETLSTISTDRFGTRHLDQESREALHRYDERKSPLMMWEMVHYEDLMKHSNEKFTELMKQKGATHEESSTMGNVLHRYRRAMIQETYDQTYDRDHTWKFGGHEDYSSKYQGEEGRKTALQFMDNTRHGAVSEHETTKMLIGDYPDSHLLPDKQERLAEFHHARELMDPKGADAREYAGLLNESKERLLLILSEDPSWRRYDDRDNREAEYLAESVRQMVSEHWNPEPPERRAELTYNKDSEGNPTNRNRLSNFLRYLDVAGTHMDRPPGETQNNEERRAYLGLSNG